ncbi:MAG: hypothetical protein H6809_03435 [Phycisphaeraceae bacterium]|nr:hypothetical protein [Phycisphaeraceae bacterium]
MDRHTNRIGVAAMVLVGGLAHGLACGVAAGQSADLRYRWEAGQTLRYEAGQQTSQEMKGGMFDSNSEIDNVSVSEMNVVGVSDGVAEIEVTTRSIRVDADMGPVGGMGGGPVRYDSENPDHEGRESDPLIMPFVFLLGKTYTMTLDEAGELRNLDGYAEIVDAMLEKVSPQMRMGMGAALADEVFAAGLEQMWHVVPGGETEVGESWESHITQAIPMLGNLIIDVTYTFEGMREQGGADLVVISSVGTVSIDGAGGMGLRITEGSIDGEILFDAERGVLVSFVQDQTMVMSVNAGGMEMEQRSETRMSSRLLEGDGGGAEDSDEAGGDEGGGR